MKLDWGGGSVGRGLPSMHHIIEAWWCMPIISAFGKWRERENIWSQGHLRLYSLIVWEQPGRNDIIFKRFKVFIYNLNYLTPTIKVEKKSFVKLKRKERAGEMSLLLFEMVLQTFSYLGGHKSWRISKCTWAPCLGNLFILRVRLVTGHW